MSGSIDWKARAVAAYAAAAILSDEATRLVYILRKLDEDCELGLLTPDDRDALNMIEAGISGRMLELAAEVLPIDPSERPAPK